MSGVFPKPRVMGHPTVVVDPSASGRLGADLARALAAGERGRSADITFG